MLEAALTAALHRGEFELLYQPQLQVVTGRVCGLEALLRWRRPGHGLAAPNEFLGALEDSGLIVPVGAWVIRQVCRQMAKWRRLWGLSIRIAVNVSSRQFAEAGLVADVAHALESNQVPPQWLEIELTETALMLNTKRTEDNLLQLKALGVPTSIDDFGTGYSSFSYLRRFAPSAIKIDKEFIREITTNADDAAITGAIIDLAHKLGMSVVAEGVETAEQLAQLQDMSCDIVQGFYHSRPLSLANVEVFMTNARLDHYLSAA